MTEEKPARRDLPYFKKPDDFKPVPTFPKGHAWHGQPRCQGWNYRSGRQCMRKPSKGKRVCKHDGGMSLGGLAAPKTTTGVHSKFIVARLAANYHDLLELGESLFTIRDETALLKTMVNDALLRFDTGESGASWARAAELHKELERIQSKAVKSEDDAALFTQNFIELGQILRKQSMAYAARDEAVHLVDNVRRFVADENKKLAAKYKAMREDEVLLLMTAVVGMLKDVLTKRVDLPVKNRILTDMQNSMDRIFKQ
jgi:hypothetical protein